MEKLILAYDFGTSGVKAALVDYKGTLLGYKESPYPLISEYVGWAEQNPDDYWNAVCKATREVMAQVGVKPEDVDGMAFGTQGMGIIPVDENGNVLHNNITWVDSRAREQADEINEKMGDHVVDASDTLSKILWYKQNKPELWEKTKYILDCTGFLNMKATGEFTSDYTGCAPYYPQEAIDRFLKYEYTTAGIPIDKFPKLIPCSGYVGNVTPKAAAELGVTTDVEVYMGVVDVTVAAIGAGCCKEGDVHAYLGTSGWISAIITGAYRQEVSTGIYQVPHLDTSALIYGGCVQSACLAYNWALQKFYPKEWADGTVWKVVEQELADVPAGSNGILASPWLMGERCPIMDEKAKGVFIGISNITTRAELVNAMQESIVYSLRMQLDYYKADIGKWPEKMSAIGGGCLSDHWMQTMADICGIPTVRPKNCRHSGAIGGAAIVACGKGRYKMDELDSFVQTDKVFQPNPENVQKYNKLYDTWKEVYPALKDIFAKIN